MYEGSISLACSDYYLGVGLSIGSGRHESITQAKQMIGIVRSIKFAVLANPARQCGVRLAAEGHANALNCPLITEPHEANAFDFVYLHWHPNFDWQHPRWAFSLKNDLKVPSVLIVHDFLFIAPVDVVLAIAAFDLRSVPLWKAIKIPMPLQQPYPFIPKTEPDPDKVGFFGFYNPSKGAWSVLAYAKFHKKKAKFITTLHPFAPPWTEAEFSEFVTAVKRSGFEIVDEWLRDQELADCMGECGFFVVLHSLGGFGASASVTSPLAARRPVFIDDRTGFAKEASMFALKFRFDSWPSQKELNDARELIDSAWDQLRPEKVWNALHSKVLDEFHSRGYNLG